MIDFNKLDWEGLRLAVDFNDDSINYCFLNTHTGEVIIMPQEILRMVEDEAEDKIDHLLNWEKDLVPEAREIVDHFERFERIPTIPPYDAYNWMVEFADSVTNPHLRDLLFVALNGKGAFRRFKNVLMNYPKEQELWYKMIDEKVDEWIREWLNDLQ